MDNRDRRILQEIVLLASDFEELVYDDERYRWVVVPEYPLPPRWAERRAAVLVVLPDLYPAAPPLGFYLNRRFKLKDGGRDPHLLGYTAYGTPNLMDRGWRWYCTRVREAERGGWHPSADCRRPDNLQTYLLLVQEVLTNDD